MVPHLLLYSQIGKLYFNCLELQFMLSTLKANHKVQTLSTNALPTKTTTTALVDVSCFDFYGR